MRALSAALLGSAACLLLAALDPALAQDAAATATEETARAEPTVLPFGFTETVLRALAAFLVLAVLLESGLEVIFRWRVYEAYFARRGLKPVVAVVVAYILVTSFDLDLMGVLIAAYHGETGTEYSNWVTRLLTALILAGGSAGVNTILTSLNIRTDYRKRPEPPRDRAWISVRVEPDKRMSGPAYVQVTRAAERGGGEGGAPPVTFDTYAGATRTGPPRLSALILREDNRFPPDGGYTVVPDVPYRISVTATGPGDEPVRKEVLDGPVAFAPGAVIDFEVSLARELDAIEGKPPV